MAYLFEHFDGDRLPQPWRGLTSGSGRVVLRDSNVVGSVAPGGAAAICKSFDGSRNQIVCSARRSTSGEVAARLAVTSSDVMSPGLSRSRLAASELLQVSHQMVGNRRHLRLGARSVNGKTLTWSDSALTWTGEERALSVPFHTPLDDYVVTGFEWEGERRRTRLFVLHAIDEDSLRATSGPRLIELTDWIDLPSVSGPRGAPLWRVIGIPEHDGTAIGSWETEYVAEAWGSRIHGWTNQRGGVSARYNIKHHWGYDLRVGNWLPQERDNVALQQSGTGYDADQVQWGSVLLDDDGTYIMTYSARPSRSGKTSVALATSSSPDGPWHRYDENPVVRQVDGTDGDQFTHSTLVKDWIEADPERRYKLLCTALNPANVARVVLFTAPRRFGPWTYPGVLIEELEQKTGTSFRGAPLWHQGNWHLYYSNGILGEVRRAWGPRLEVGAIRKEAIAIFRAGDDSAAATVQAIRGRVITVANTKGFARDAVVLYVPERDAEPDLVAAPPVFPRSRRDIALIGGGLAGMLLSALGILRHRVTGAAAMTRRALFLWSGAFGLSLASTLAGMPAVRRLVRLSGGPLRATRDAGSAGRADRFSVSRVRKVLSDTELELYHSLPGALAPGEIRTANRGSDALQGVVRLDDGWAWITTAFKVFHRDSDTQTHFEMTSLRRSKTLTDRPVIDWHATPLALHGRWNNALSSENLRLVTHPVRPGPT